MGPREDGMDGPLDLHLPVALESQPEDNYSQLDSPKDAVAFRPLRSKHWQLPARNSDYVV